MTILFLKDFSFPSAHAALCFSLVPVLDREYPHFKSFWIGFAVLVAFSRLYLGVHYFSDVMAGAFIGLLIGDAMLGAAGRWKFLN
jgi:undecaprenyl-diphosphatase